MRERIAAVVLQRPERRWSTTMPNSGRIGGRLHAVLGRCRRNKHFAGRPQPESTKHRSSTHPFIRCLFVDRLHPAAWNPHLWGDAVLGRIMVSPLALTKRVYRAHDHRGNGQRIRPVGHVDHLTIQDNTRVPLDVLFRYGHHRVILQQ